MIVGSISRRFPYISLSISGIGRSSSARYSTFERENAAYSLSSKYLSPSTFTHISSLRGSFILTHSHTFSLD